MTYQIKCVAFIKDSELVSVARNNKMGSMTFFLLKGLPVIGLFNPKFDPKYIIEASHYPSKLMTCYKWSPKKLL